jgi:hypothetical protein
VDAGVKPPLLHCSVTAGWTLCGLSSRGRWIVTSADAVTCVECRDLLSSS